MKALKNEISEEVKNVINFWSTKVIDQKNNGFYGACDFYGKPLKEANKGVVLNARLLWSFAKISNQLKTDEYTSIVQRSYKYLQSFFKDADFGGVYWELNFKGIPLNTNKKSIAQAYTLLALSEVYLLNKKEEIKEECLKLYNCIEENFYNKEENFYKNTLTREFKVIEEDVSLTLGTHLHIIEAYTNLYKINKSVIVKESIENLLNIIIRKFLKSNEYCEIELSKNDDSLTTHISFGHNVEVPCILLEACAIIRTDKYVGFLKNKLIKYSEEVIHLINRTGGVYLFKNIKNNTYVKEYQWWMQTESLIAFQTLSELTSNKVYSNILEVLWTFIKNHFIDIENGEWYEKLDTNKIPMKENKITMWKSPYHIIRMYIKFQS